MELRILYKNKETVELQLTEKSKIVDMLIIPLDFNFDTVLVTSIDKIFKRNRIERASLLEVSLEGFDDKSSMVSLIAQTVAEALKVKQIASY